ncbi:hypothetical protein GMOD_00008070 [Pyrenophora seminiperda CCB06]|uniref:Uncharacterized protein n=1 Tax=Pyrenophora seminiperda CCB06 TaxID=1302712 RepID=A0A3M7MG91_9PLEO|nr:hypothetical protein GMOD_00008070 [Pyrenophora seminiperda CCB06]
MASPQPRAPQPPPHASPLYKALHLTTTSFVLATAYTASPSTTATSSPSPSPSSSSSHPLTPFISPSTFTHSFAPAYLVSLTPSLQHHFSFPSFLTHISTMTPHLQHALPTIVSATIDEVKMQVVLRVSFRMLVKGAGAGDEVVNEVMWFFRCEGGVKVGEGVRIVESVEFVDGRAAGRVRESMGEVEMAGRGMGEGGR